jgi:two-component system, chemotaxis family, chemotaxis protein CheY
MQKRALIVDEDRRTSNIVEGVLNSMGIESLIVAKTAEAMEEILRGRFLVAFFDLHLTVPNGLDLMRRLRDSPLNATTPVIILSSDLRPKAMTEGFQAGATFFLYKPVERDCLHRLVRATHSSMELKLLRRTRRVPLSSKIQLYFRGQEFSGETINASLEGLLIKAASALPIGSSIDMHLHLAKNAPPISASGSIVRLGTNGEMGIHLARMKAHESQRLEEFLLPFIPPLQNSPL